jgi:hypothetical protein
VLAEHATAGREAHAEAFCGRSVEPALPQELAARLGLGSSQLCNEEVGGALVGGENARAVAVVGGRAAVFVVQLVAQPSGHALDGLAEAHVVHLLEEGEHVAALAATEAVVETDLRTHVETGAALLVERAQALHRAGARVLEAHVVADDVGDVGARPDLVDIAALDEACHVLIVGATGDRYARCRTAASRPAVHATPWRTGR